VKTFDFLDLTPDGLAASGAILGQHSAWLPREGIKVPFQWGGRLQKYGKPGEASYPLEHLAEDLAFSRWLAERRLGPPVGEVVYFKTIVSEHPGAWWADPCGAYGYEMAHAESLSYGPLVHGDVTDTIAFRDDARASGLLEASPGAWNDLNKPGNAVNGYLVDVRRSGWDRVRWHGPVESLPCYEEDVEDLVFDLICDGQFPFRQRELPYQEYYLDGSWLPGERDVRQRAALLGFAPKSGETILDVGCQLGGFLALARLGYNGSEVGTVGVAESPYEGRRGGESRPLDEGSGGVEEPGMTVRRSDAHARSCGSATGAAGPNPAVHGPHLVGLDWEVTYVNLARRLARANRMNICYRALNAATRLTDLVVWLARLWPRGIDHLLLLSMAKHFPGGEADLWRLVDALDARMSYLESNAAKENRPSPDGRLVSWQQVWPLRDGAEERSGEYVGDSTDRNTRRLYRVPRW